MVQLIIVAHEPLASALAKVAAHTFPECAHQLACLDVSPADDMASVAAAVRAIRSQQPGPTLIMTDVLGATPANGVREVLAPDCLAVTGVSVPMLWRTLCYRDRPLPDLLQLACQANQAGCQVIEPGPPTSTFHCGSVPAP